MRHTMMQNSASSVPAPTKPSCSPTAVKMKSVCCSGTLPSRVWLPLNRPSPSAPPAPIAVFDWSTLYFACASSGSSFVDVLGEERREPGRLVLLQHVRVQREPGAQDHDEHEHGEVPSLGPGDQQHAGGDRRHHQRGAEVGLQHDQAERQPGEHEQHAQPAQVDLAAELRRDRGQRDDQRDLGDLGRLQLEAAELEPRLRALARRTRPVTRRARAGRTRRSR